MDNWITIQKIPCGYKIAAEIKGEKYPSYKYYYYSCREAIKKYREENNLKYKHLIQIKF